MTARQQGDDALIDLPQDADESWVSVRPDNRTVKTVLIAVSPLIVIGAVRFGLMMARGRGVSEGSGMRGLVIGILAVFLPFIWFSLLWALRWANAGILLEDGVLTVRNRWNRCVLRAPVSSLTGLHEVGVPVDGPHGTRIVITSGTGRPVLIDPRAWDPSGLGELWRHLPLPLQNSGFFKWPELKQRFPRIRRPWHRVHYGLFVLLATIGCIAYIALVVNLPFLL